MKLGLIGNPLGHSWSPQIHRILIGEDYQLWQLKEDELDDFFCRRDFDGINVTIPYKQTVMKYLDEIDPAAEETGAVNCIVNRGGVLKGYNTDYSGLRDMLKGHGVNLQNGRTAILGSGGASKAAQTAVKALGGRYDVISRREIPGCISYEEMYRKQAEYTCLINATPVGMYPECDDVPADLNAFSSLHHVVDIIANPLRTRLQWEAKMKGIPYLGGFEMLVRQAADADLLFTGIKVSEEKIRECIKRLLAGRRNIVLIGMPTSGKTTLASMLREMSGRTVYEMDDEITEKLGTTIAECFADKGESYFRQIETETAAEHRSADAAVISCGGGVVKKEINMRYLGENGIIVWVNRAPRHLFPTDSRPLSTTLEQIEKLYDERVSLYERYSDITVENNGTLQEAAEEIIGKTGV